MSAAWMVVPSMPTSPSFCPFLSNCSANARGVTFFARMCALHCSKMFSKDQIYLFGMSSKVRTCSMCHWMADSYQVTQHC